jgi:hypothetical protein
MILFTVVNIVLTEIIFYVAELLIKKKIMSCLITIGLALYVMLTCFGGNVASLVATMMENNGKPDVVTIVLFFFNMFYSYMRGLERIRLISKKYGNLGHGR